MPFQARVVMSRASVTLNDTDGTRWPAPELRNYLNDALREIAIIKPNSVVATIDHPLVAGTEQTLPSNATLLVRAIKNTASKRAISVLASRAVMDRTIPGWQNPSVLPNAVDVAHVIYDAANPKVFHVVPGNTGTGRIEIVVCKLPDQVAAPSSHTNTNINSYTDEVDLDSIYISCCIDYVVSAALMKDAGLAGAAARSAEHYQRFRASLEAMSNGERGMSINASPGVINAPGNSG